MNEDIKRDNDDLSSDGDAISVDTGYRYSTWPFDEDDRELDLTISKSGSDVTLDWETSDRITVCTLKHHLDMIYEKEHRHKVFAEWYHEEDKEYDRKLKKALKRVLKYFGEEF